MRNLSARMHAQVLILLKNILDRFDGKTFTKMNEFENFFDLGNPYALKRPGIAQFLTKC